MSANVLLGRIVDCVSNEKATMKHMTHTRPISLEPKRWQQTKFGTLFAFCVGFLCGFCCTQLPGGVWRASVSPTRHSGEKGLFLAPQAMPKIPSEQVTTEMRGLQIDVFGLPAEFLDSTERVNSLVESAIDQMTRITVLQKMTYHFDPSGLTSLWLLSASHASIHTWPAEGYAAIDVLTCGNTDLIHISKVFQELFADIDEDMTFRFSLTERGQKLPRPVNDLAVQMMQMQLKKSVAFQEKSKYQSIDVLDVQGTDFADGEHVNIARRLYLDGVLQLSSDDEYVYHEAFIHPAMLAHKGPQTVCIMGGGDGGALMNVLHHRSVNSAFLVEIDDGVIEVSKKAFPKFKPAFFDPRAHVVVADAFGWIGAYSKSNASTLDALFFDLLDINVNSPLLDALFMGDRLHDFVHDLKVALREDGVAVFQLGERGALDECASLEGTNSDCVGVQRQRDLIHMLGNEFKQVRVYSKFVPSFLGPWLFAVASNDHMIFERWGRSVNEIDADIAHRLYQHEALGFFTGSAMHELRFEQEPTTGIIQHFENPRPEEQIDCGNLSRAQPNNKLPGYEIPYMIANSKQGIGLGIFTLRPIRRGEVIWRFYNESFIEVLPNNWKELVEAQPYAKQNGLDSFLEKDWINEWPESDGSRVKMLLEMDDGRLVNHGYASTENEKYMTIADQPGASQAPQDYENGRTIIALRDINACEEILETYTSGNSFLEDEGAFETPQWWIDVLKSRGFTKELEFPPAKSPFPAWYWLGKPANSD